MGYVEDNLMTNEKILYKAKLHWVLFLNPLIALFFAAACFFIAAIGLFDDMISTLIATCLAPMCLLVALGRAVTAVVLYFTTEFALTNGRIIAKTGFVRRRSIELLLMKVESIGVDQSVLGRLMDYGTITVTGTGGTKEPFPMIAAPLALRKRVNNQIAGIHKYMAEKQARAANP